MVSAVSLLLSVHCAFAAIPGWDSYKVKDFCNGTCPSSPDSSGLPKYGQYLFPSITMDSDGHIYLITAKFGGAYLDAPELTSFSPSGEKRWTLTDKLAPGPQSAYWMQIRGDALYVQSSSCCTPEGATKGHIVKVSLNGTALWSRDVVGSPVLSDGKVFTLATPDTGKGSIVSAMSLESGKELWSYNDGVSRFMYLEIGGKQAQDANYLCMPSEVGSNKSVVCLDSNGKLAHTQAVTDSPFVRYDLIANANRYYVRQDRDNSYYHKGANEIYDLMNKSGWSKDFPDDTNFVGVISRTSGEALVVLTRPDCPGIQSGLGCRPDSVIAFDQASGKTRWNVTLPGAGDVAVNPAFPPQFGPYGASNGMVFASSVKTLHADNKTYDMWYSAIDKDGKLVWKLPIANIGDLTRVTYAANTAGDFHVIFDGVLYKVPAKQPGIAYV